MRIDRHIALILALVLCVAARAGAEVEKTVHNLSSTGLTRDGRPVNPCDFCHTPHNGAAPIALWNRAVPSVTYKLYESSTLKAKVNQPTGSSRLCLSCHDGTIALDDRPDRPRTRVSGALRGKSSLGTDLSDDHPISFTYNSALSTANGELTDPAILPSRIKLDSTDQMQCTTCHNPHEDRNSKFLVTDNRFSQLCVTCHRIPGWNSSIHAVSTATWKGSGANPWAHTNYKTVAENGCDNCHHTHSAGRPEALLTFDKESKNCFACHNATGASKDIQREFRKFSAHPVEQTESAHKPKEDLRAMSRHVACSDCHDPHSAQTTSARGLTNKVVLSGVSGISTSGSRVSQATMEYEVCYKCHGVSDQNRASFVRANIAGNVRTQLDPSNQSFHPVAALGRRHEIRGLEPGYTASSVITCSDCHNSDSSMLKGPHGSQYEPILERQYDVQDPSPESYKSYSLCYKCHNRASLLTDQGGFPHKLHVVDNQASCAVCHDAHGSRDHTALINFMVRGKNGAAVVSPSSSNRLEFQSLGAGKGQCYLRCHGSDHNAKSYPTSRVGRATFGLNLATK